MNSKVRMWNWYVTIMTFFSYVVYIALKSLLRILSEFLFKTAYLSSLTRHRYKKPNYRNPTIETQLNGFLVHYIKEPF